MSKVVTKSKSTIDDDGVVSTHTESLETHVIRSDEPKYAKLYFDHLLEFKGGILTASNLLLEFAAIMTYDSDGTGETLNLVYINSTFIRNYCTKYDVSRSTYNRQVKSLIDCHIMRRVDRGTYQLNPNLIAKGDWIRNGIKTLRATFDYLTGEVTTDFEAQEPQKTGDA